tara:strand:+ start:529 stop:1644 length:1116 start_codon:yes stop_codon:yes gene_type:complete
MNFTNLIVIVLVILVVSHLMSNNSIRKENREESNKVSVKTQHSNISEDETTVNNSNVNVSNEINSNVSGNNVNFAKENFETTVSDVIGSIESYKYGYRFNVDIAVAESNKYFVELYNPKSKMLGVLYKSFDSEPLVATKDENNANQHFEFVEATNAQLSALNVTVSGDDKIYTVKSNNDEYLHYDGDLSVLPSRGDLKIGNLFLLRSERKSKSLSEYDLNASSDLDKTFNFDGNMSVNDYNNNLYRLVSNINRKVNNLYLKQKIDKEDVEAQNPLSNESKPLVITINASGSELKSPVSNNNNATSDFSNTAMSITERFNEIKNAEKKKQLDNLVQETVYTSGAEIKCPQLDKTKWIHKNDINCYSCNLNQM